ncbi:hypothetical protein EJ04DRAFT_584927 [Polyplosphaeria fusca]|uniref:Uncharacterized protein n=1 Tax=Polyplosphaeria fusca TaxID=682080 RepID=A0A9P4QSM8_9PLEO|nr:hypothetical protein EJ04DRAFT_584927 [Polyplosphaeria fusca]
MGFDYSQKLHCVGLHWTQRIALVRHNLHAARRTGDFTFFKTLQAHSLIDGTDHVAILHSILGADADSVLATLDNLNAGIAYVHQDAFKAVYDGAKSTMYKASSSSSSRRSLLRVDINQQKDMADHAIDKTTNSAINLIEAQPVSCQDAVANAWITGTTIIADAVCVCLMEMDFIEEFMDDYIRLEYCWSSIQNSVDAAVSALRGIFTLMAGSNNGSRNHSVSSTAGSETGTSRSRTSSTASALGLIKRAFSHSHLAPPAVTKTGRTSSLPGAVDSNAQSLRLSMNASNPTRLPGSVQDFRHNHLSTIPPTPSAEEIATLDDSMSPFKDNKDYFTFDVENEPESANKVGSPISQDLMQLESLDPLYSPTVDPLIKMPIPLTLRRLSESFGIAQPASVATV